MSKLTSLKISISGVRGVVGQTLTPQLISSFAAAFGSYSGRGTILVGSDTRPSRHMVVEAVHAGLLGTGVNVKELGVVPVPTVQIMVKHCRAFGGIAVTASHNPIEWNAMKFIGPEGLFLNQYRAEELLDIYHQGEFRHVPDREIGSIVKVDDPFLVHLNAVMDYVDVDKIRKCGFKVGIDCVNGAGSAAAPRLLSDLGCKVVPINTSMTEPFPHSPEPIPENLKDLAAIAKKEKVDIAFAQDADADRLAIVCPEKGPIGEEYTMALALSQVLKKDRRPVVVNLSTSMMVDDAAMKFNVPLYRTPVGEINVTEKLLSVKGAIGGEGNGGVIIPSIHPCRDSFAGMAVILQLLAEEQKPLHEIVGSMPSYSIVKRMVKCPSEAVFLVLKRMAKLFNHEAVVDKSDGVRITWKDKWLQVRASNTEPIVRVFAEAHSKDEASSLIDTALAEIKKITG